MAALIDFTTAYTGGPGFFTGIGSSSLVPDVFPVAIGGHAYMLDMKSGQYGRAFEPRLRDSSDDSNIPGEAALNSQGLWRRSQVSWHKGSAQQYADTADGVDTRFWVSKNVDPWTKGQLSLLKGTTRVLSSSSTNLKLCVVGDYLYVADNKTLKFTSDPYASSVSWTSVTSGAPDAAIEALATDGTRIYVSYNNNSIYSGTAGGSSVSIAYPSSGATTFTFTVMEYVKGRIMSAHDNDIHANITGAKTAFWSHPNTSFRWVGFASGQNAIYAAGNAGKTALIYKITIKSDGTLDVPVVAGELPVGETITSLSGYLGNVLIGTDRGVRLATPDQAANLVIGPVLETTTNVKCAVGFGRFMWYGWTNFDTTSTGLGRLDLSELNGANEPAYASDLMADVQGAVNAVVNWGDRRIFSVSGQGVYVENAAVLASSGYADFGFWRWGIPDKKLGAFVDLRTQPLNGSLVFSFNYDNAGWTDLPAFATREATTVTLDSPETSFVEAQFKLVLNRASSDSTKGPVLTRWQFRAFPSPQRSELFSVPLLLHRRLVQFDREYYVDVDAELDFLRGLINLTRVTTFQQGKSVYKVVLENVQWVPMDFGSAPYETDGTAVVTMRSLTA